MPSDALRSPSVEVLASDAHDGAYAVLDIRAPAGATLPPHVCSREDTTLVVLAGRLEVVLPSGPHLVGAGDHLALPRAVPRRARVLSDARLLCIAVPGGVECLVTLLRPPAPEHDDLTALLAAAGVDLLPHGWGADRAA